MNKKIFLYFLCSGMDKQIKGELFKPCFSFLSDSEFVKLNKKKKKNTSIMIIKNRSQVHLILILNGELLKLGESRAST